jgi:hypothetical protein
VTAVSNAYHFIFADFAAWDDFEGEEGNAGPDGIDWAFNFLIVIVISMVLFNLTVSIFTDVYGTILENNEAYDVEVLNEVTMDVEVFTYWFLFWRSSYKKYENFDQLEDKDATEEKRHWFGK